MILKGLLSVMSWKIRWKQGSSIKYSCSLTISILDSSKCSNSCCGFPRQDDLSPPLQGGLGQGGDSMGGSFAVGTGTGGDVWGEGRNSAAASQTDFHPGRHVWGPPSQQGIPALLRPPEQFLTDNSQQLEKRQVFRTYTARVRLFFKPGKWVFEDRRHSFPVSFLPVSTECLQVTVGALIKSHNAKAILVVHHKAFFFSFLLHKADHLKLPFYGQAWMIIWGVRNLGFLFD